MSEKVLVISGASKGIGAATAEKFLAAGYRVINLSRSRPDNPAISHITVDLKKHTGIASVSDELHAQLGDATEISVIHNAGLLYNDSVQNLQADALHDVLQVNVVAALQLNQLLLPKMGNGSSIIYVGSTLSEKAVPNSCSYVVSKHAVVGLMRASCQDLAGSGVHTVCVCPGFTETEMLVEHVGGSREILNDIASGVTFGRLITPQEMADVLYMASNTPILNGAVLHANLGQVER